jgi:cobalt-zinc-cadmium efflux system outer membrane protein
MSRIILLAAAVCAGGVADGFAQSVLTFEDTIARARDQAGAIAVARARIAEAEAGIVEASARFRDNPMLEGGAGPRYADGGRPIDLELGISQQFETGGQRRARIAAARAAIDHQRADADETRRRVVFAAATAFVEGVAANERLQIAEESDVVSRELVAATERRFAAGDVAAMDLNLARIEAARSIAALRAARADLTRAVGALRGLLRLPESQPLELRGTLDTPRPAPLASLRTALDSRPDFVALRAELREATAQQQLGAALRRPDLGVRLAYEREETHSIVLGGLTIALPMFQSGQGVRAVSDARAARARVELETTQQEAIAELETAYAVSEQQDALVTAFVGDAMPSVIDNEGLARRSYEAGEINLMDLLLIRREALETRTAMIDRRLDAAHSRLMVDFLAGVLR